MNIDEYLARNGLSIQRLAELTGYNPSSIHHWLAGTRAMSTAAEKHLELLDLYMTDKGLFPWRNEMTPREKRWAKHRAEKKTKA